MANTLPGAFLVSLNLQRESDVPLYYQIYQGFRRAILDRQLSCGIRLPSSRDLADLLDVSRNTVLSAIDQLIAEGYLETRPGAGTYVATNLPEALLLARDVKKDNPQKLEDLSGRDLSARGHRFRDVASRVLSDQEPPNKSFAFALGKPDFSAFPYEQWAQIASRVYRYSPVQYFADAHIAGYFPLREAIAEHLGMFRSVKCTPHQILITAGSQEAMYIAQQILLNRGDRFWMENPGYIMARVAIESGGAQAAYIDVDVDGINVDRGIDSCPEARLAYVTPSHQFPLGYTMSLERRLALLNWAEENSAWIVEDDYDSEYRYVGAPIASLQGLDVNHRVVYIGTFSKVLFPTIRLGYMVVPEDMIEACLIARMIITQQSPIPAQMVLAEFMREGHFMRHIRRMRKLYNDKRQVLLAAIDQHLGDIVTVGPSDTGMNVTLSLPEAIDDMELARVAWTHGLMLTGLSQYYQSPKSANGLVLGYTAVPLADIGKNVKKLAEILAIFLEYSR
jgi:GntR family transcriptional regulator/MocR family aminotransferase